MGGRGGGSGLRKILGVAYNFVKFYSIFVKFLGGGVVMAKYPPEASPPHPGIMYAQHNIPLLIQHIGFTCLKLINILLHFFFFLKKTTEKHF